MVLVMLVAASLSVAVGQLALGASLALFLVVANTFVDIVYAWLDPRIRFD